MTDGPYVTFSRPKLIVTDGINTLTLHPHVVGVQMMETEFNIVVNLRKIFTHFSF